MPDFYVNPNLLYFFTNYGNFHVIIGDVKVHTGSFNVKLANIHVSTGNFYMITSTFNFQTADINMKSGSDHEKNELLILSTLKIVLKI